MVHLGPFFLSFWTFIVISLSIWWGNFMHIVQIYISLVVLISFNITFFWFSCSNEKSNETTIVDIITLNVTPILKTIVQNFHSDNDCRNTKFLFLSIFFCFLLCHCVFLLSLYYFYHLSLLGVPFWISAWLFILSATARIF